MFNFILFCSYKFISILDEKDICVKNSNGSYIYDTSSMKIKESFNNIIILDVKENLFLGMKGNEMVVIDISRNKIANFRDAIIGGMFSKNSILVWNLTKLFIYKEN